MLAARRNLQLDGCPFLQAAQVVSRDGLRCNFAQRDHSVLAILRLNGHVRTVSERASAMRCDEQELKPVGYFVYAILDSHPRHLMFPLPVLLLQKSWPRRGRSTTS